MSSRNWQLRISDILDAIDKIARYTAEMTLATFAADEKTVDAVLRNLEVIGEAARNLPDGFIARQPQIAWPEMRGMRNIIIHEYFGCQPAHHLADGGAGFAAACPAARRAPGPESQYDVSSETLYAGAHWAKLDQAGPGSRE